MQLLLLGLGFVVWKFLNKFFDHNKQQSVLLNQMMTEIKSEFSTHRDFVKVLKSDLQDDISKLGQNLDLLEQRVDSLSTSVAKLEFIADDNLMEAVQFQYQNNVIDIPVPISDGTRKINKQEKTC